MIKGSEDYRIDESAGPFEAGPEAVKEPEGPPTLLDKAGITKVELVIVLGVALKLALVAFKRGIIHTLLKWVAGALPKDMK